MNDNFEKLQKLVEMKEAGHLTEEEFEKMKADVLSSIPDSNVEAPTEVETDTTESEQPVDMSAAEDDSPAPKSDKSGVNGTRIAAIAFIAFIVIIAIIGYINSYNDDDNDYSRYSTYESLPSDNDDYTTEDSDSTDTDEYDTDEDEYDDEDTSSDDRVSVDDTESDCEIVGDVNAYSYYSSFYVEGKVKNNTAKRVDIRIAYKLYDSDGNFIGSAVATIYNVDRGETALFNAMGDPEGDVAEYKLDSVDTYDSD